MTPVKKQEKMWPKETLQIFRIKVLVYKQETKQNNPNKEKKPAKLQENLLLLFIIINIIIIFLFIFSEGSILLHFSWLKVINKLTHLN